MTRKYELKVRAERQQETRRRIVEAAIELHRTKGPARTTLSEVARLAGVQRHTLYRHFPDERELALACSGLYMELNPPPDPGPWAEIPDPAARLQRGLGELYRFYERAEDMLACVLRDAEIHAPTREMFELRAAATMTEIQRVLADPLARGRERALLAVGLDFHCWRRLATSGLSPDAAAEAMTAAILAQ
jgi:AcrR family transcriptional regulator